MTLSLMPQPRNKRRRSTNSSRQSGQRANPKTRNTALPGAAFFQLDKTLMKHLAEMLALSLWRGRERGAVRFVWVLVLCGMLLLFAVIALLALQGSDMTTRPLARGASLLLLGFTNRPASNSVVF